VVEKKKKKEKKIGTGYPAKDKAAAVADGKLKPEEAAKEAVATGAEEAIEKLKVEN
jgi:tyrosyl-tRNA synthetase